MIFLDFETFKYNWLIGYADTSTNTFVQFWDDPKRLEQLYEEHKYDIFVGHNIKGYDQWILKSILAGFNPIRMNDWIIVKDKPAYQFSSLLRNFPMVVFDTMVQPKSLKQLEGFMGNSVEESEVDFRLDRALTQREKRLTEKYNRHDVEQCIEVFMNEQNEFDASMGLIQEFPEILNMYDLSLTKAQMSAKILECERTEHNDEFDLHVLPCIDIKKYKSACEFFIHEENHWYKRGTEKNEFKLMVAGLEHTLGWGGIHAGREKYHNDGKRCQIWHVDVASFYPRLMIFHNLLTRNCKKPKKFRMIYDKRLKLKHEGKKKEQAPLKVVINGTYGICKDKNSNAYDPRQANMICLNGQLMLIDLIEHLEVIDGFELIQSNTDGLIISLPDTDEAFEQMDDICYEWETRCNMELEFDQISEIHQKDVNNYVFKFANGKLERKGAYVKELSALDNDLPIVNKALVDYMINGVPVEKTITECDDMEQFQQVKKISAKYEHLKHGDKILNEKCVRVYASKYSDGGLFWKSVRTGKYGKVTSTPEQCFVYNGSVKGMTCPDKLDKGWYIQLALKRLEDYGIKSQFK